VARDHWPHLSGTQLVALGRDIVVEKLERLGCTVTQARDPPDGRLEVQSRDDWAPKVFVSAQRVGGYAREPSAVSGRCEPGSRRSTSTETIRPI
jgi:hypothetical protein